MIGTDGEREPARLGDDDTAIYVQNHIETLEPNGMRIVAPRYVHHEQEAFIIS